MKLFRWLGLALWATSLSVLAQNYPDKSKVLKIVVPFGTGSSQDLLARAYGRAIAEMSDLNVIVENKAGANGIVGMLAAKTAAPDGYTLILTNSSVQVLNVHMLKSIPYDPVADFVPLWGVAKFSLVLNAGPATSFNNAREFVEAAKNNPEKYRYGYGSASTELSAQMIEHMGGIKMLAVPYKTMAAATVALASGEIDVLMNDASTAIPFYKSGKVRPLATTGAARMVVLPEVPTLREQGLADYEFSGWTALYFPAKTPAAVVSTMQGILQKAAKSKYVAEALAINAFEPLDLVGVQLTELQRVESEKWGKLVRSMKLEPR